MADIKISQLGEALAVTDNDILPMTASGVTSKVKASTMKSYMVDDLDVSDLHDTTITTPTDDDGLVYDATAQKWENKQITTKEQWKKNGAYNLLPNNGTTQSINGIVFTVNSDGTVSISTGVGGATQSTAFILFEGVADWKSAKLTGCPSGGSITTTYDLFAYDTVTAGENYDIGNGVVLASIDNGHKIRVGIRVRAGFVATTPVVFKPMITTDLNATYDDYVPHAMTNRQLTEDALTANDVAFVKEAFNLQANSSKTITLKTTVSLLVGVYGSNGFAYLVHDNGGVYQIANSNDGISASLSTHTLTITNSGTHSYRTRLLELGQS